MLRPRLVISNLVRVFLVTCCLSALAQPTPVQWVGDLLFINNRNNGAYCLIDENNILKQEIPFVANLTDFPLPQPLRSSEFVCGWHNDGLYAVLSGALEENADGSKFRRNTFAKWQNGEWDILGSFKMTDDPKNIRYIRNYLKAIPCDNDRFVVISGSTDLKGSYVTPFARMSLNSATKEIRFDAFIDHGQDEIRDHMSKPEYFRLAGFTSHIIMTDSYATLLNWTTGMYWIFSLEKASLVKSGKIFKSMTVEKIAKVKTSTSVIMSAHPEKDYGTILISSREESAIDAEIDLDEEMTEFMVKHRVGQPDSTVKYQDYSDLLDKRRKEVARQHPWIVWHRLYPETGKIEKIMNPEGAAIERGDEFMKTYFWRPMPDGSVKMGYESFDPEKPSSVESKCQ